MGAKINRFLVSEFGLKWTKKQRAHQIMCPSYCEVSHEVCYQGSSKITSLLVLSATRVRLPTSDPRKPHPRWESINGIWVMVVVVVLALQLSK